MNESAHETAAGFTFLSAPADYRDASALVVRIPRGIRSKRKLLAIYADKLRFPNYFGWNWDAFEECLSDLSWLPDGTCVAIIHEDLPFGSGGANRGIYLSVLSDVVRRRPTVCVILPTTVRDQFTLAATPPR